MINKKNISDNIGIISKIKLTSEIKSFSGDKLVEFNTGNNIFSKEYLLSSFPVS
jgi:hypothetical protein